MISYYDIILLTSGITYPDPDEVDLEHVWKLIIFSIVLQFPNWVRISDSLNQCSAIKMIRILFHMLIQRYLDLCRH